MMSSHRVGKRLSPLKVFYGSWLTYFFQGVLYHYLLYILYHRSTAWSLAKIHCLWLRINKVRLKDWNERYRGEEGLVISRVRPLVLLARFTPTYLVCVGRRQNFVGVDCCYSPYSGQTRWCPWFRAATSDLILWLAPQTASFYPRRPARTRRASKRLPWLIQIHRRCWWCENNQYRTWGGCCRTLTRDQALANQTENIAYILFWQINQGEMQWTGGRWKWETKCKHYRLALCRL